MEAEEVVGVAVLEFLFHEDLLDVPGLDGLDLKDGANSVAVEEFAEFVAERGSVVFAELEFGGLALVHAH